MKKVSKDKTIEINPQKRSNSKSDSKKSKKSKEEQKHILDKYPQFQELNDDQKEAVVYNDSPLLILAGVGTGKTQTLMSKYAYLVMEGQQKFDINQTNILAVTFTNKAAKTMQVRASQITQRDLRQNWIGTFHSLSARMLLQDDHYKLVQLKEDYHLLSQEKQRKQVRKVLKDQNAIRDLILNHEQRQLDKQQQKGQMSQYSQYYRQQKPSMPYSKILRAIDTFKNRLLKPDDQIPDDLKEFEQIVFYNVYELYQESMRKENLIDFGDLLMYVVDILKRFPEILQKFRAQFKYILVDEVQDLNYIQQEWLKLIVGDNLHLTCVGDDDQMVYGFRGASGDFILNFEHHFDTSHTIKLEQNYRSTKKILEGANNLISKNFNRKGKTLWTDNQTGEDISFLEYKSKDQEIQSIVEYIKQMIGGGEDFGFSPEQIAILTRTNADGREIEKCLIKESVNYELAANKKAFLDLKEVNLALMFLVILHKPFDNYAWKEILGNLEGFGKDTVKKITTYAEKNDIAIHDICEYLVEPCRYNLGKRIEAPTNVRTLESRIKSSVLGNNFSNAQSKVGNIQNLKQNSLSSYYSIQKQKQKEEKKTRYSKGPAKNKKGNIKNLNCDDSDSWECINDQPIDKNDQSIMSDKSDQSVQTPPQPQSKPLYTTIDIDHKLTKKQREKLEALISARDKYKKGKTNNFASYLEDSLFYDCLSKISKTKEGKSNKVQENVRDLLEIALTFEDIDEFFNHITLFSGDASKQDQKAIKVMTIHASKGLEFNQVFLPFWVKGKFPVELSRENEKVEVEEERRTAFVGLTRAREHLFISHHEECEEFVKQQQVSQFVQEIQTKTYKIKK
eukprot:403371083